MTVEVISREEVASTWVNASGVDMDRLSPVLDKVSRELANWVTSVQGNSRSASPSVFNRAAYVAPDNPYSQMVTAKRAVENDDIIGGVADVTEGLMFQGVRWESSAPDDADIFNQISRDLNLDEFVRQFAREDYTYCQVVIGMWWGFKSYTVRGKTPNGNKKRKTYNLAVPVATTILDPQRVVPLKPGPFGQDRLAWHATRDEMAQAVSGLILDPVLAQFTAGPARVSAEEALELSSLGVDPKRLLLLNEDLVFRYTRTKMPYERFAPLRMKSVFALLDLKQQLIDADRVSLVGAANFILLVRQGTKDDPALPEELDNLRENFKVVAKLPVVIGDHRLNIDIITPSQEFTLDPTKYDTVDRRILSRVLGALTVASSGQRNETTLTIARGVARLLENRRHMMKRLLEERFARQVVNHPANQGLFTDEPNLTFTPRNVQLDSDSQITQAILSLRTQRELSRESVLEYFGFDQAVEALRREIEEEAYDDIFKTQVPFAAGGALGGGGDAKDASDGLVESPQMSGARGGRPSGGGQTPQSPQRQTKSRTSTGAPTTRQTASTRGKRAKDDRKD